MHELADRKRDAAWIESTHDKEAARSLEMLHVQLVSAVIDPYSWKWSILACHHVLHAFLLHERAARIEEGAEPAVGIDPREVAWLQTTVEVSPEGESLAVPLPALYEAMKRATGYAPTPEIDRDVLDLSAARDRFVERMPAHWQLHVRALPGVVLSCLEVVDFLGWNPGHLAWGNSRYSGLAREKHLASQKVLASLDKQYREFQS